MSPSTSTRHHPRSALLRHGWRPALVLAGLAMAAGGRMHPSADASDPLRQELATMTGDPAWVPGHTLIMVGTLLLVGGLWAAHRGEVFPARARRALWAAALAFTAYAVETVFHLAAAVDHDNLEAGEAAPVAFMHVGLSVLLYPVSGLALLMLGLALVRSVPGPRKAVAALAVAGGALHAISVPATLLLPDTELSPLFAGAGMLIAAWSLLTGLTGVGRVPAHGQSRREPLLTTR